MKFIKIVFPSKETKSSGTYLINDKSFENIKQIVHQDIITSEWIGNLAHRRYHQLNGFLSRIEIIVVGRSYRYSICSLKS